MARRGDRSSVGCAVVEGGGRRVHTNKLVVSGGGGVFKIDLLSDLMAAETSNVGDEVRPRALSLFEGA